MTQRTEIRYGIYQIVDGHLKEPKRHWDDSSLMFPLWFSSHEEALQAIQKEEHAPTSLIIMTAAIKFWD